MSEPLQFDETIRETLSDPLVLLIIAVGAATVGYQIGAVAAGATVNEITPLVVGLTGILVVLLHATETR